MNSKSFAMALTIAVCVLIPLAPGFCEKINTPQGMERLGEIHDIMQIVVQHIRDQNAEKALALIKDAEELWQGFTAHHEEVFAGELNPAEGTVELIAGIPDDLDALEQSTLSKEFDKAEQKVLAVIDDIASLNEKVTLPVLLDFTGPKCKSCKVMKARLTQVAPDYAGRVRIVLVDVNVQKDFTRRYKIMLIPTLVFIDKTGTEISRHVGQMEEPAIRAGLVDLVKKSDTDKR